LLRLRTLVFLFTLAPVALAIDSSPPVAPETVVIPRGGLHLKAFLWKPTGPGPFESSLANE